MTAETLLPPRWRRFTKTKQNIRTTLEIKGGWIITKDMLKQKWAKLTDDDLQYAERKRDEVVGRIQQRTGETSEVVGEAESGRQAVKLTGKLHPPRGSYRDELPGKTSSGKSIGGCAIFSCLEVSDPVKLAIIKWRVQTTAAEEHLQGFSAGSTILSRSSGLLS